MTSAIGAEASRIQESLVGAQCDELVPTGPNTYRPCRTGPQSRRRVDICDQKSPPPEDHDFQGHKVCYDCRTRIVHEQDDNIASKFPISAHLCKACTEELRADPSLFPPGKNECYCFDDIRDREWKCKACYVRMIDRRVEEANQRVQDLLFTYREKFWEYGRAYYRAVIKKTARKWLACAERYCGKRAWTTIRLGR